MRRGLAFVSPVMLAFLLALVAVPLVGGAMVLASFTADLPSPQDLAKDPLALSTKIYDRTGTVLLYQLEVERREAVRFDDVPRVLIDATVAAEDKTFWTNPGVDILGIARAVYADLTRRGTGQGGASTITQQLVKQRIVGGEVTIQRKIREAILAIQVTRTYSKREILELYFNQIYYGNQAYGVKAAAETYFGKADLSTLTLAEAALLAGLPQAPSAIDPSQPGNVERAEDRRAYVLAQMEDTGAITEAQRAAADAEPIKVRGQQITTITAPHFVFQVRDQLTRIFGDEAIVTRGGFKVTTTLDMKKQAAAEKQVKTWVTDLRDRNVWNAGLVSIEPKTGEVLSYVGSVDYYNRDDPKVQGQFDVAGIGVRQPGSSFKVFNYLTALKKGATAATVVVDARTDFTGKADAAKVAAGTIDPKRDCGYCPENADSQYHGPLSMRQAIRESRNVPAVKFLQQYSGIEDTIQTARDLGITTPIDPANVGLSLTLGAKEVKLLDMTSAFGTVANLGVRVEPTFVLKVEDPRGKVVWEHKDYEQKRVLDAGIAYIMTDILKDTTRPDRDFIFGSWTNIDRPAALKTGTTDDLKDVYSVGYVPQLVTGVWMGNSNADLMSGRDFFSAMGPGQLWREYMKEVLTGVEKKDWEKPANVVSANVVLAPGAYGGYGSGMLPSSLTPFTTQELFIKGTEPRSSDNWYTTGCPKPDGSTSIGMRIREVGPAVWAAYTQQWISDANKGLRSYGRYTWNVVAETCPSPSRAPSPSPSPSGPASPPSGTPLPPGSTPAPTPVPTLNFPLPPGITFPPGFTPTPRPP
ncbi:MAG: transglycosylase domain-containing protein [Chloroflexi bacterium]|nr:transglycosylase domain-containing protein [Chloroflexota bacterium]